MEIYYKRLFYGFQVSIILIALLGFFALHVNRNNINLLLQGDKHFKLVATAATEVSSFVKRAEGHLFLYLVLNRKSDGEKFPKRVASMQERISLLDKYLQNPKARIILEKIKIHSSGILNMGNMLVTEHDDATLNGEKFEIERYRDMVYALHDKFSAVRKHGVELAALEIDHENSIKQKSLKNAMQLRLYIFLSILLVALFSLCLGYYLLRLINTLNRENSERRKSENELFIERNKLKAALDKVQTLSGLLPICSMCKKIRDDKGYWNQIETYIKEHSEADFSHGICPDCAKKYYSEYFDEEEN